ncbi:MAG: CDP-diacylglycerol--glycerol-3-phosphate 3-phosphatidyltransferase [Desulfovibrionaceae bacterium]
MRNGLLSNILNIANQITLSRIFMTTIVVFLLYYPYKWTSLLAAIVFVFVALTDILDGYLARKYNFITTFGKFLDPVADKILTFSALIMLVHLNRVQPWIVIILLVREFVIMGLRAIAAESGHIIPADTWGKFKTALQCTAITMLILHYPYFFINPSRLALPILYLSLFVSLFSATKYIYEYYQKISTTNIV